MFVDTSVWSLSLRRHDPPDLPHVHRFRRALRDGAVVGTGLVLQELFQGLTGPKQPTELEATFRSITLVRPSLQDHLEAAEVRNRCRRGGLQLETVDALIASLCIRRGLELLTADDDFRHAARHVPLAVWEPAA